MKKFVIRIVPIAVAMLMLFIMLASGCQGQIGSPSRPPKTEVQTSDSDIGYQGDYGVFKLPIVDTKQSFTVWAIGPWSEAGMRDANDSITRQWIEELTNIHIVWLHPALGQEAQQFNLIVASQNYPDAFFNQLPYYIGGLDKFVDDDVILDLKPLLYEYAPNYMARRDSSDEFKLNTITDEGRMPTIRHFKQTAQPSYKGPMVRADWLEDLNIKSSETFGEWEQMLVAFKDSKGADLVQELASTGQDQAFLAGFGISPTFYQKEGQIRFGPVEPEYRDYVTLMSEWYSKGIIDKDFFTRGNTDVESAFVVTGRMGSWFAIWNMMDLYERQSAIEGYSVSSLPIPVVNKGDTRKIVYGSTVGRMGGALATISTSCGDVPTLLKYLDYFYTDEGSLHANFGIENETYIYNEYGKPEFTELIGMNPEGLSLPNAITKYSIYHSQPFWYDWRRTNSPYASSKAMESGVIWDSNYVDERTLPEISIAAEESQRYSRIFNDVTTYVQEMTVKFITDPSYLAQYDAMVNEIKHLGIDEAIAIQQAALDRFNSRSLD